MKKRMSPGKRLLSLALAVVMVFGILPLNTRAEVTAEEYTTDPISTVADPQTIGRPGSVYGENTKNAGKVTVGKSVHNGEVEINYGNGKTQTFTPEADNFIITTSQAAQVVGLASESAAPVDVVFVLDTSNSMNNGRATSMVAAANKAIASLMAANKDNRVGVVAFSGTTSSIGAANQLSALAHYDDVDANGDGDLNDANDVSAASNHLRWGNSNGTVSNNGSYIIGRGTNAGVRQGVSGGTNIHAGIALGAQMLTNATSTTVLIDGKSVTRMPFLVVLSDGAPTFSGSTETWYTPAMSSEQGPGNSYYSGNGFLAALTAAYYKGKITEHYYGSNASEKNRCHVYTIGVGLESLTDADAKALAQITMDPDTFTQGTYAAANAASWWNYGRTHNESTKETTHGWKAYWDSFQKTPTADFGVEIESGSWQDVWVGQGEEGSGQPQYSDFYDDRGRFDWDAYWEAYNAWTEANYERVWVPTTFTITADTITAAKNYVNGLNASGTQMYNGGIAYNDDYFKADETSEIEAAFNKAIQEIQLQAMNSPTHVQENHGADFSGYVTFTDPIGEYMEVKKIYGLIADGNYYQGKSFAQYMQNWNSGTPQAFKDNFLKVLKERCRVTGASLTDAKLQEIVGKAIASDHQAYYKSDADYDNSFVWWGKSYTAEEEEDVQLQLLDFAEDDSVAYITNPSTTIPTGADYVCRSYYFYGTAGGTVQSDSELMHFVVRVQRSLKAPYQETVVISAPASLLSMEKVLITEKTDAQGKKTYSATVTEADPARVVYEVGLRSDINAFNVAQIVGKDTAAVTEDHKTYVQESAANYDAATGTYHFYTNDWNRTASESSHHRAMAHATFDAAADNAFYTYTENTPIYTKNGDTYTLYNGSAKPSGVYYYARTVYDWSASTETGDTHTAVKRTEYILVDIPENASVVQKGTDSWYIAKGAYKASSLSSAVEDVPKNPNNTGSATIVVHPHRTEDAGNSHYTVLLGNNGKLSLKAADTKSVMINAAAGAAIRDDNGKVVMVGDKLTYTLKVINGGTTTADATATDTIPVGTVYVDGSVSEGGSYDAATKKITWNIEDIPAGHFVEVSFTVQVTEDALTGDDDVATIDNQAYVKLNNGFEYQTNPTKNPPEGKKVVDSNGAAINGAVAYPDVLVYRIRWHNDSGSVATVKITDVIPAGTTYVENSASDPANVTVENGKIVWTFENVQPGTNDVVSFRVNVNATAGNTIENGAQIKIGNNDPRVTNKTTVPVSKGDLVLSKNVVADASYPDAMTQIFTLNITEIGLKLNGTFPMYKNGISDPNGITFNGGIATVSIQHGDVIEIQGITAGTVFSVVEASKVGFTPSYTTTAGSNSTEGRVTVAANSDVTVAVTNTYAPNAVNFTLKGVKKLQTTLPLEDTTFGFVANSCDETGALTGTAVLTGEVTVSSAAKEAVIIFADVTFPATGIYYYLIREINGGVAGITYAENQYLLTVTVTDNGTGTLQAAATLKQRANDGAAFSSAAVYTETGVEFTNTYAPLETQLVLEASKVLNGRDLQAGEFSFVVTEGGAVVTTATNNADGTIRFRPITYSAVGDHTYTITEVNGGLKGVTYSDTPFTVTVSVTDNGGHLVATPNYPAGGVNFINTYTPDDVQLHLSATKTLTNNAGDPAFDLKAEQFAFVVLDQAGNRVAFGNNDAGGAIAFSPISYTKAMLGDDNTETFTYTVKELVPDELGKNPNMKYDGTVYTVTVTVTYDAGTGTMSVGAPTYKIGDLDAGAIAFTNIQQPTYIDVPLAGSKTTTGSNLPAGLSFSFSVADTTGAVISGGTAPANGDISFTNLSYTTTGTHYYWIYESNHAGQEAHGVQYSGMCYVAKVDITRDADSKLVQNVTYYKAEGALNAGRPADPANYAAYTIDANKMPDGEKISFANVYAAAGSLELEATKILTVPAGSSHGIIAGDYLFRLDRLDDTGAVISSLYATNDDTGHIRFPSIVFTNDDLNKTIRYVMSEEVTDANRLPGVTYNTTKYYIEVTLTADGSNIVATPTYYSDAAFQTVYTGAREFVNAYAPAIGTSATFRVQKELTGRKLAADEFSFLLYHVTEDAQGNYAETLVDVATNTVSVSDQHKGEAVFIRNYAPTVTPGTYKYAIVEHAGDLNGVTYSTAKYWALVTIHDNGSGSLICDEVTYYSGVECTAEQKITDLSAVKFVNTYDPQDVSFTPAATKVLRNRHMSDNEFSFVVMEGSTVVSTGWSKADGTVVFSPIGYTTAGEHTYTISEVVGNLPQVTYTNATYELKVTVADDTQAGRLVATGVYTGLTGEQVPEFVNTYTPSSTSVQLHATKKLENHAMKNGSFSFVVRDNAGLGNIVATGGNVAAHANETVPVIFSNIGFTFDMLGGASSKEFIYSISEQPTTHGGVTKDDTIYYAKVVLTHNSDGTLSTEVSYYKDKDCLQAIDGTVPAFINTYDPIDAELTLYADKTLINKKLEAGEFTFTLSGNGVNQSLTNDATGRVVFDKLTFSAPGTYRYTLTESVTNAGNAANYTLDHSFQAIVKVEDDLRGNLVATVDYHEIKADGQVDPDAHLGGAEFINYYTAPPVKVNLTEAINATKTVQTPAGVTFGKAGFMFQVTDATGKIIKGWSNGTELDMIGVSDADGKISFPDFYFPTAGEYHYWITEQPSGIEGMTHDPKVWEVHILVRYNDVSGELEVKAADVKTYLVGRSAAESNHPVFVNSFDPTPITITLTVDKVLDGRELKDREFLFQLVELNGNGTALEGERIIAQSYNNAAGKIIFHVTYSANDIGTHAYAVREMIPENANNGIDYDNGIKAMPTVSISYDTASHKLVAKANGEAVADGAVVSSGEVFQNKYTTQGATVQIKANKVMTANRVLKDKEFTFGLMDGDGKVVATAKNNATGWIVFQMSYDKAGIYTYEMFEQTGDDPSLVYDNTRHKVVVTVTDDMQGKLHAEVAYKNNAIPTFVNDYRAVSTAAAITAKKTLIGNKTLAAGDFTFELEREDGAKVSAKNATDGSIVFGMRYDAVGVYTYTLRELPGDAAGVTYDDTEYKVIVTVTDDLQGHLNAVVTYEGLAAGETVPTFVNTYKGKAASAQITATKTLTGKSLTADAFTFTLTNKDNSKDVYTAKNDAKGNVVFDLNLTEVGTYTYILAETTGTDANTTYDKTTCTVTVKVTDDLKGNLSAEVTYDTADGKAPAFQNVYTPSAVTVELIGEKKLSGRTMKKEEFKFEVRDSEGNVVATARNDAEGKLVFSAITLKTAGKYVFTVTEVKGGIKGMIYDTTAYEVTVEVVNDNGQLKTTVTGPEGGLVFRNTYKDPDPSNPGTGDDVPLFLLIAAMVISGGAVVVLLINRKKKNR